MNLQYINDIIITGNADEGEHFQTIAINSSKIDRCLDLMKSKKIYNLSINSEWGWKGKGKKLDFLKNHLWIEGICIYDEKIDVEPINFLQGLKKLQLTDRFYGKLDFNNFKRLELFWGKWNKKQYLNFFDQATLKYLGLSYYDFEDLMPFKKFEKLVSLQITYSKIVNLHGVKNLRQLQRVVLQKLPAIDNINEIEHLRSNLRELTIIDCKNLYNYLVIEKLALEKLVIGNGNPIESVKFLEGMDIKSGHIGIEVLDKDISILNAKGISYKKFKGYG